MTTVPVTRAVAVNAAMPRAWRLISGDTGRTAKPSSGSDARWTRATALATRISDRIMCPCTAAGWRSTSTVTPPSTIWARTPVTSPSDSHVRSRRRGTRTRAPSTAAMTARLTSPVNRRLSCSMAACGDDTSMNLVLLHAGQSAHPNPDPVRRTAAPVTMIAQIASRAPTVTARYCDADTLIAFPGHAGRFSVPWPRRPCVAAPSAGAPVARRSRGRWRSLARIDGRSRCSDYGGDNEGPSWCRLGTDELALGACHDNSNSDTRADADQGEAPLAAQRGVLHGVRVVPRR